MAEDLEIKIGADTSQLQAELQAAQNEMKRLEAQIKKTSDVKEIQKLQTSLRYVKETMVSLEAEGAKLNNVLDKGLKKGAGGATQTLTDLSRIAQDAPYGFIAISNNINPLVESFGRLRAETGSTGGALKSLVSGLAGGGGLGLAFGVVTAAISFAQVGFDMWTRSTKKAKEAADETKKAIDGIYQAQAKEGTDVISLIAVLKSETETRQRKLDAIKELNKISPEVFNNLKLEKDAVIGLDSAYKNWLANQKTVIAAKILQGRIDKKIEDQLKVEGQTVDKTTDSYKKSVAGLKEQRDNYIKWNSIIVKNTKAGGDLSNQQKNYYNELNRLNQAILKAENNSSNYTKELEDLTQQLSELSKGIDVPTEKKKSNVEKKIETWSDALAKFEKDLSALKTSNLFFNVAPSEDIESQIKKFKDIINTGFEKFGKTPQDIEIQKLSVRLGELVLAKGRIDFKEKLKEFLTTDLDQGPPIILGGSGNIEIDYEKLAKDAADRQFFQDFNRALELSFIKNAGYETIPAEFNVDLQPANLETATNGAVDRFYAYLKDALKKRAEQAKTAQVEILSGAFSDVITNFAENLGTAIASGNFAGVFQGLFDILGNAAIQLGKNAILFSEAFAAIKKALASGSATLGIGAGIALIALGALIKAAGKKLTPKFATGTTFAPGGMALVGERGPELVNLPRGSQVIPSGRTSSMVGAMQSVEVYGKLRGQDIYFSNKKYSQTYNRQT